MSQRIGMADGRCITDFNSTRILNDFIIRSQGIDYQDNYRYRMFLQSQGPDAISLPLKDAACSSPAPFSPLVEKQ